MKKTKKPAAKGEQSFPGYPKYPATEDIVYRAKRVEMDLDGDENAQDVDERKRPARPSAASKGGSESPSDVTRDDLQALNSEERSFEGDDEVLKGRVYPVDFSGEDLDVPGAQQDPDEETGNEDEENKLYSLGGENHEDLEEDRT
ncbi:hypothetical protein WBG78_28010 [Chryseolinea sp. T2]|uniref:hypothetical protein n=1 Tax=Chryseolinea sp. T2 TaxID=3129255 RepID=UPI0030770E9D